MTRMLDILEDYFRARKYNYERLDGNTHGTVAVSLTCTLAIDNLYTNAL